MTGAKYNKFRIAFQLPTLNDYTYAQRVNRYVGAKFKKGIEQQIKSGILEGLQAGTLEPRGETPSEILIVFYEKNKRRDVDNIQSSTKFILDSMVGLDIIKNDTQKYIKQVYHFINHTDGESFADVYIFDVGHIKFII